MRLRRGARSLRVVCICRRGMGCRRMVLVGSGRRLLLRVLLLILRRIFLIRLLISLL